MDTISGAALAREIGTSGPRVTRAVEQLGIDARQPNGRFAFTPSEAERLRQALGATPRIEGLSRPETAALAALRNAPFGLVSARAVSRRSGLAPTTAGRALDSLLAKGLVERENETIAAGRAREITVWRANLAHPRWSHIDPALARFRKPERPMRTEQRVPRRLRHLFWNTAESQLDVSRAGAYIARRLLLMMDDLQGLAWGAQALKAEDWEQGALARGLDPKVKRLARNLAEASR
ncbi:MAG: MarR family transcriptional regulator [Mycobacteriales bacterium]